MREELISPYIRVAMRSTLMAPFCIRRRIIFDYEVIFVEEGRFELELDGCRILCREGDAVFLRPNHPHSFTSVDGISVSQPHIHFDMAWEDNSRDVFVSFQDLPEMTEEEKNLIRKDVLPEFGCDVPGVFQPQNPSRFHKLLLETVEAYSSRKPCGGLLAKAKLTELLYEIFYQWSGDKAEIPSAANRSEMQAVKSYVEQNCRQALTLERLAKQFGMSPCYLTDQFRKQYGQSLVRYYNQLRLEQAKLMLMEGVTVSEAAERLGFGSLYAFSRFFKQREQLSPSAYRKKFP